MTTDMNKEQAKIALKEGKKLTHRYFAPHEYIYLEGNEIVHEDGARMSVKEFWAIREGGLAWDDDWELFKDPVVLQSPDMIVTTYTYREEFIFQRMLKDQKWYVTYKNYIIAHGMYRNDLEEWIDTAYPKEK